MSLNSSGNGYVGEAGENIPPFDASNLMLSAGTLEEASTCDIIVIVTPFPHTASLLESLKSNLVGKGKIFIDMTNPWYSGTGLPSTGLQSAGNIMSVYMSIHVYIYEYI